MIAQAIRVASGLSLLGTDTKNETLKSIGHAAPSYLRGMSETKLITTTKGILEAAQNNATALAGKYQISAADITLLDTLIKAFEKAIGAKGSGMGTQKSSNKSAKQVLREITGDLDQIDTAMELLPKNDKDAMDFYLKYFSVRGIKDTGIRHKPPKPPNDTNKPPDDTKKP